MSKDDAAFMEVLASCTDACEGMDLSDSGWSPPDGTYDVEIVEVATGLKEKNGVNNAWVKPSFRIIDGEFAGKTFTDFYWFEPAAPEPTVSLKNLCRFASCLSGNEVQNPIEAITIVAEAIGEFLAVEVYRNTSKKGKVFTNIRFLQTLVAQSVTDGTEQTPREFLHSKGPEIPGVKIRN